MAANNDETSKRNKDSVLINVKRFFISSSFKNLYSTVSTPKKDPSKRMSVASDIQVSDGLPSPSMACPISHAASMPALSCSNCLQHRNEVDKLKLELMTLKRDLKATKLVLEASQKTEKTLRERLSTEAQKQIKMSDRFEDVTMGNNRPTALIQQYGMLYSETRVDALDSLDAMPELAELDNLKNKLLFSVIVLSFRQCQQKVLQIKEKIYTTLGIKKGKPLSSGLETATKDIEHCIMTYLRLAVNSYDIKPLIQEVQTQIYSTLYDYPCLKACDKLKAFISESTQIAWKLCIQNPPCQLEFDCKTFNSAKHERFHSSNGDSEQVKSYVWPALLEAKTGVCLYKGTVVT